MTVGDAGQVNDVPQVRVDRLDHLVLTVADLDAARAFYTQVLGMEAIAFGEGRHALRFGRQKINLHLAGQGHPPVARRPVPGSADLCFITEVPLVRVVEHLRACGVGILEGPVAKTGALGPIRSVYFRDPDGNLVEVSNDQAEP